MNKLSLKVKLGVGFGVLLVLIALMGYISYSSAKHANLMSDQVAEDSMRADLSGDIDLATWKGLAASCGFLLSGDEQRLRDYQDSKKDLADTMDKLNKKQMDEEEKKLVSRVQQLSEQLQARQEKAMELRRDQKEKEAVQYLFSAETQEIRKTLAETIKEFDDKQNKDRDKSVSEGSAADSRAETVALALAGVGILLGLVVAALIARSITGAIARMLALIEEIAANNLAVADMETKSKDEIGQACMALNKMKNNLHQVIQSIAGSAMHVASASEELNATSQQITANSEETSAQADVVSKAAQAVSQNLQTVATGAEEMGASIKEIAKNATEAARVATAAVKVAETTTATVSKLGDSSTEIGQVIKVITSIAQQTNLLALNATIEAARAGEAGKGFAVVANEVKELAKETAKATEDISRKIEAIQTDTKAAVDAIASISGVVNQINDISGTIATAVEEQNATTNEMSRNVSEAAHGSGEITSNIAGVAEAAQSTTHGATDTQKATQLLVETSAELRRLVEQFKINAGDNGRGNGAAATQVQRRAAHAGS